MISIHTIHMELNRSRPLEPLYVMQNDKYSRDVKILLTLDDDPWPIPDGTGAVIHFEKADGTGGNYDQLPDGSPAYSISDNELTICLAPQVCTFPGAVKLTVTLINGERVISTFAFYLSVQRAVGLEVKSENYFKVAGALADSGWEPDMYLGTDENGNVVVRQLDISRYLALRLDAEDFTQGDVSYFTYSEAPAWDWLTSADNLDFELTCVVNGETNVYKKEDCHVVFSGATSWIFEPNGISDAAPWLEIGNKDDSMYVSVSLATEDAGAYILESCALKVYRKRNFVQTVNGIAPDASGNVEVETGGGITAAEKKLILSLLKAAAYTEDVSAKISELEALWSVSYPVTYNFTGVAASNNAVAVVEGGAYSSTLTAEGGYTLTGAEVTVIMGGVDITSEAYSGGVINIAEVTGNIVITAVAAEIPSYSVTNNLTGVTTDNSATKVSQGGSYTANLTVEDGYVLSRLVITMGGVDITADVYGEGYILIPEVTGDVVITAVAAEPQYVGMRTHLYHDTATMYSSADETTTLITKTYISGGALSLCRTESDVNVIIRLTNNTDSDVTASSYAGCVKNYMGKVNRVYAYNAILGTSATVRAGQTVEYTYTLKAGFYLYVFANNNLDVSVAGVLDIHEPVAEYGLTTAYKDAWYAYSDGTTDNKLGSGYYVTFTTTTEVFEEDTELRITLCNGGTSMNYIGSALQNAPTTLFYAIGGLAAPENGGMAVTYYTVRAGHVLSMGMDNIGYVYVEKA